jgi:two-component system, cell cycle response regulator DivK
VKYNWGKYKVLVIEDDPISFQLLEIFLKKTGIHLFHAKTGSEVMQLFEENCPDIVLMDVQLPDINGIQLTQIIKSQYPETPIIAQTASILETQIQEMMDLGCEDYVLKPIDREDLLAKIHKYLIKSIDK